MVSNSGGAIRAGIALPDNLQVTISWRMSGANGWSLVVRSQQRSEKRYMFDCGRWIAGLDLILGR